MPAGRRPDLRRWERGLYARGCARVAGVDEAGRGPLAGPVAAAAVFLAPERRWVGLDDSKALTPSQRQTLYRRLTGDPDVDWAVAMVDAAEIDRWNIREATHQAMRRALAGLRCAPDHVLVDGLPVPALGFPQTAIVRGDAASRSIAAASILAKVTRDQWMTEEAERRYPGYGFAVHKGYGTPEHLAALAHLGPCPLHRRSFAPVREQLAPDVQLELGWPPL